LHEPSLLDSERGISRDESERKEKMEKNKRRKK
jgi:hypothetical protein